jgi:isopentenyl phosphate kinase
LTENGITIFKLGGSCFSEKTQPRSLHLDVLDNITKQLAAAHIPMIIVHGGGSYGHPIAKKYSIHLGWQANVPDQARGFCETHEAMVELNHTIVTRFLNNGILAYPVQTSAAFVLERGIATSARLDAVDALLDQGFVPVMYGDSVVDTSRGFGIMSGDAIIVELANRLRHRVARIVYLMDVDGLFVKNPKIDPDAALIPEVIIKDGKLFVRRGKDLVALDAAMQHGGTAIDVTGGIFGKIKELSRLQRKDIVAFLISGRSRTTLAGLLRDEDVPCTRISLESR